MEQPHSSVSRQIPRKVKIVPKNWVNLGKQQGNNLREAVRVLKTLVRIKENIMPENIYQTSFTD